MNISSRAIIKTRCISPTNSRGARIKATCQRGSVTIPYAHEASGGDAHWLAVQALLKKFDLKWGNKFTVGSDNDGYYFIPAVECNVAILGD